MFELNCDCFVQIRLVMWSTPTLEISSPIANQNMLGFYTPVSAECINKWTIRLTPFERQPMSTTHVSALSVRMKIISFSMVVCNLHRDP